ncbi:hypothetical protein HKD37_18G050656 [Glycine soja]
MKPTSEPRSGFYYERFDIYIACFRKLAPTDAEKREELEPEKRHANRGRILAFLRKFQTALSLPHVAFLSPSFSIEAPNKASTFGAHFCSKSRKESIFGVVKCVATSGTSKFQLEMSFRTYEKAWTVLERTTNDQSEPRAISRANLGVEESNFDSELLLGSLSEKSCDLVGVLAEFSAFALFCLAVIAVLFECCFVWMLWKLGRIDGDPVLRETRIWATWEYVNSVGEWYLEICRGGQETLGTSGGVLLPKTKLDQSRPTPGIVGQLENEVRKLREPLIMMAAQLTHDRVRWSV